MKGGLGALKATNFPNKNLKMTMKTKYHTCGISTVKYQKRLTPLLVIVQERVKIVQFC